MALATVGVAMQLVRDVVVVQGEETVELSHRDQLLGLYQVSVLTTDIHYLLCFRKSEVASVVVVGAVAHAVVVGVVARCVASSTGMIQGPCMLLIWVC